METNSTNTSHSFLHLWTMGNLVPHILIVALGVPLNLLVLGLVMARTLPKVSEIFALNQVVCELGICMGSAGSIAHYYLVNKWLVFVMRFTFGLFMIGRLHFMFLVCGSCYIAVAHPVVFLRFKVQKRAQLAMIGVSWLAVLAFCLTCIFISERIIGLLTFILTIVSMAGQIFFCMEVFRLLLQSPPGEPRAGRRGKKLTAFTIIATLLLSTMFTFLPFVVMTSLKGSLPPSVYLRSVLFGTYLTVVGGYMQPLLWLCRARKLPCMRAP